MKNITLKIDDDTHLRARVKAAEQGTSLSAVTRQFLQDYADQEKRQKKEKEEAERLERVKKLRKLWALADDRPQHSDVKSIGPLNRDEIYDRGLH